MRVRLFSRGARWVWKCRKGWLVWHRRAPAWAEIFGETLEMMSIQLNDGELSWQQGRWWTFVKLRLGRFSPRKRELIAAALWKATRFN